MTFLYTEYDWNNGKYSAKAKKHTITPMKINMIGSINLPNVSIIKSNCWSICCTLCVIKSPKRPDCSPVDTMNKIIFGNKFAAFNDSDKCAPACIREYRYYIIFIPKRSHHPESIGVCAKRAAHGKSKLRFHSVISPQNGFAAYL